MDIKEIKQKLYSYKYIEFKIEATNNKLNDLAALTSCQRNVKSQLLTGMPCSKNISDTVADSVYKIIDIYSKEYERIKNELDELFKQKREIADMFECLDSLEKEIIELKYFKKYKWWMVSQTIHMSETHCRRRCSSALLSIKDALKKAC